jgi:hypothetical protein
VVPAGRDVNASYRIDVPSLSLPGLGLPRRCPMDAVLTATLGHRCRCPAHRHRNAGPSMLFLAGQLLHGRRQENSASEPAGDTAKLGRHG